LIKDWGFSNALIRQAINIIGYENKDSLIQHCLNNEEVVVEDKQKNSISLKAQLSDDFNSFISS
jgi:hypothetical protein